MNRDYSRDSGSAVAVVESIDDRIRVAVSLSASDYGALDTSSKAATVFTSKKDVLSEKHGGRSETYKCVVSIGSDLLDIIRKRTIDPQTFEPASDISWSTASVGLSVGDYLEGNETDFGITEKSRNLEEHKDDCSWIGSVAEEDANLLEIQDALENLDDTSMNVEQTSQAEPPARVVQPKLHSGTQDKLIPTKPGLLGCVISINDVSDENINYKGASKQENASSSKSTAGSEVDSAPTPVDVSREEGQGHGESAQIISAGSSKMTQTDDSLDTAVEYSKEVPDDKNPIEQSKETEEPQSPIDDESPRSKGSTDMDNMLMSIFSSEEADDIEDLDEEGLAVIDDALYEKVMITCSHSSGRQSSGLCSSGLSRDRSSNGRLSLKSSVVSICDSLVRHLETRGGSDISEMFSTDRDGSEDEQCGGITQTPISEVEANDDEDDLKNSKCSPNRPHPALEYPLLYFLLRRFQWLFDNIKILYAYRWRLSYPLQRNVPFSRDLSKVGVHFTWGEVLLILPFYANVFAGIIYTFVFPSVLISGRVARYALIAALVFAQRNSMITLLLGMPFDRSIFYHKLAGRVGGITGLLHTVAFFIDPEFRRIHSGDPISGAFTGSVNISGSVIMILIIAFIITSLPTVRRRMFEVFYFSHIFFTAALGVCTFYHSGILVPILASLIWGVDLFVRSIVMARTRYPRKAQLTIISDTVIELSFPKTAAFAYNPGQYIYIAVPEISWLQWHPFSISSSPKQKVVTLHIRRLGNWTADLYSLAQKQREISILMEGPYGNVGVDLMGDRKYKNIMLISGGIGITPMQSLCDQLLYETVKDRRELHRLKFIWIERDPILMQEAEFVRRSSSVKSIGSLIDLERAVSEEGSAAIDDFIENDPVAGKIIQTIVDNQVTQSLDANHSTNIASKLLSLLPPGKTTDEELEEIYASGQFSIGDISMEGNEEGPKSARPDLKRENSSVIDDETSFAEGSASWLFEAPSALGSLARILDMQVYLTSKSPVTDSVPFARYGRPNVKKIFLEMKNEAIKRGDSRVAVCVSAPIKLTEMCRKACIVYSDDRVRFDFHSEQMAL